MRGALGLCLQGSHPRLIEATKMTSNLAEMRNIIGVTKVVYNNYINTSLDTEEVKKNQVFHTKTSCVAIDSFILGEELGTEKVPKCGGCKCTKCPILGHTYSFQEQQEIDLIRKNLRYDAKNERWITKYPWIKDPTSLPNNYSSALATLKNCEKTLKRDEQWAKVYSAQIQDMIDRNVARKLSKGELEN